MIAIQLHRGLLPYKFTGVLCRSIFCGLHVLGLYPKKRSRGGQTRFPLSSALSGKFTPLLRASFRRQLCCATSKDSRHSCVARLTDDENPSRINTVNFPDSTLVNVLLPTFRAPAPGSKVVIFDSGIHVPARSLLAVTSEFWLTIRFQLSTTFLYTLAYFVCIVYTKLAAASLGVNSEALALKKVDIDLKRWQLTVEADHAKNAETKTRPILPDLGEPLRAETECSKSEWVFVKKDGVSRLHTATKQPSWRPAGVLN